MLSFRYLVSLLHISSRTSGLVVIFFNGLVVLLSVIWHSPHSSNRDGNS